MDSAVLDKNAAGADPQPVDGQAFDSESEIGSNPPGPPSTIYSLNSSAANMSTTSVRTNNPAPSIRSRVTVVCAECKRLKLKCDRRLPCGSCQKRDAIPRCIYSQAASEKVDVQTLHNRLSTVEATLTTLVSSLKEQNNASTPSTNPIPSGSSTSTSGVPRRDAVPSSSTDSHSSMSSSSGARMLAVAPNGASVVVNLEETAGLWVSDLEAELGREGPRFDLRPADLSSRTDHGAMPRTESGVRPATARDLLHRHIGIAVGPFAEASAEAPDHDAYGDLLPELLSQFPSEAAWEHMMRKFEVVIQRRGAWCIPFTVFKEQAAWLMTFAPTYKGKAKSKSFSINGEGEVDGKPSLSLLANVAIGLAMGSLCWVAEDALRSAEGNVSGGTSGGHIASPPASAFNVHARTPHALYRLGRQALSLHYERHGYAGLDEMYILAQLMCGGYLLLSHREEGHLVDESSMATLPLSLPPDLPPLVAEVCLNARLMGLNTDPDDFAAFGDSSLANGTIRSEPMQQVKSEDGSAPVLEGRWGRMSLYRKEVRRRLWWEVCWFDMFVSENLGIPPTFQVRECTTRIPSYIDDDHMSEDPDTRMTPLRDEESQATVNFFVTRCRLVMMLKGIKARASATLDPGMNNISEQTRLAERADELSKQVTDWLGTVEDVYKMRDLPPLGGHKGPNRSAAPQSSPPMASLSSSDCSSPRDVFDGPPEFDSLTLQRCELAVTAHHEILRLYLPVVHAMTFTTTEEDYPQRKNLEGLHAIDPAIYIIRVCDLAFRTQKTWRSMLSTLSAFIFFKSLFDAAVVLAHIAIQHSQFASPQVLNGVRVALSIFKEFDSIRNSVDTGRRAQSEPVRVLEVLYEKGTAAANGLQPSGSGMKRGHEEVDSGIADVFRGPFRLPFVGAGVVSVGSPMPQPPPVASNVEAAQTPVHDSNRARLSKSGSESWGAPPPEPSTSSSSRRNSSSQGRIAVRIRNRDEGSKSDSGHSSRRSRGGSVSSHYPPHVHAQSVTPAVSKTPTRPIQPQPLVISNSVSSQHSQPTPLSQATSPVDFPGQGLIENPSANPQPQSQPQPPTPSRQPPHFGPGPYPPPPPPPEPPQFHQSTFQTSTPYPYPMQTPPQHMQFYGPQGSYQLQVPPQPRYEGDGMQPVAGPSLTPSSSYGNGMPPDGLIPIPPQEGCFPMGVPMPTGDLSSHPPVQQQQNPAPSSNPMSNQVWQADTGTAPWESHSYHSFQVHNGQQQ